MTTQTRTVLKSKFEDGDVPTQTDFGDLIDTFVSQVNTSAQSLASQLTVPTLTATILSAQSGFYNSLRSSPTGSLYAASAQIDVATLTFITVNTMNCRQSFTSAAGIIDLTALNLWTGNVIATNIAVNTVTAVNISVTTVTATNISTVSVTADRLSLNTTFAWNGETTTRASVGTGNALPVTAHGFIVALVGGVSVRIPYFRG